MLEETPSLDNKLAYNRHSSVIDEVEQSDTCCRFCDPMSERVLCRIRREVRHRVQLSERIDGDKNLRVCELLIIPKDHPSRWK